MPAGSGDRREVVVGINGCLAVFGLTLAPAGLLCVALALWQVEPLMLVAGLPLLSVGVALCLGRERAVLDRAAGVLVHTWGPRVVLWRRRLPLAAYDRVRIRYSPGDADSGDSYPVELVGTPPTRAFRLADPGSAATARQVGGELARFLGRPLDDTTPGGGEMAGGEG